MVKITDSVEMMMCDSSNKNGFDDDLMIVILL